jgi:hypothetical protein
MPAEVEPIESIALFWGAQAHRLPARFDIAMLAPEIFTETGSGPWPRSSFTGTCADGKEGGEVP